MTEPESHVWSVAVRFTVRATGNVRDSSDATYQLFDRWVSETDSLVAYADGFDVSFEGVDVEWPE